MAGFVKSVVTVLSAFVGIRRKGDHDAAASSLTPLQVIITGVVTTTLFIIAVILGVRILISIA